MTEIQELTQAIRENTLLLRQLMLKETGPSMGKVKDAAKLFSISEARIREMCKAGIIKATLISAGAKNKHFVINLAQAREDLTRGGYLQLIAEKHKQKADRGRKSSINLNHQ